MHAIDAAETVRARAVAFALTARSLAADPSALYDDDHLLGLRTALERAGDGEAIGLLAGFDPASLPDRDEMAGRWVRWFDLGRVAPYEGSNVVATAAGITPRLADISAFYRAFGMTVPFDRPDHVVAELEFVALALLHEAEALDAADDERRAVVADAIRSFVRDHVGTWLDAWAARVADVPAVAPWVPFARLAVHLVRREAAARNVVPTRSSAVLAGDSGLADDDEPLLECGAEPPA